MCHAAKKRKSRVIRTVSKSLALHTQVWLAVGWFVILHLFDCRKLHIMNIVVAQIWLIPRHSMLSLQYCCNFCEKVLSNGLLKLIGTFQGAHMKRSQSIC